MRFGGLTAVSALDFAASAGRITSIIGPNGAGKTTVFNCITGFYRPTSGTLRLRTAPAARFTRWRTCRAIASRTAPRSPARSRTSACSPA